MSREGNFTLVKIRAKFCMIYAIFSLRNFLFFIFTRLLMCVTFFRVFFLRGFLQPVALKGIVMKII